MRPIGYPHCYALTGVHKSGNSWLARLLEACPGMTSPPLGAAPRLDYVVDFVNRYFQLTGVALDPEAVARRLYQSSNGAPAFEPVNPEAFKACLRPLARIMKFSLVKAEQHSELLVGNLVECLYRKLTAPDSEEGQRGALHVAPAKHLPLVSLRARFPGYRVIWIQRDPRDVIISWLYHDLGTLSYEKMHWFSHENWWLRRSGLVWARRDWLKQAVAARASEICQFYKQSLPYLDCAGCADCLVVRYERLLDHFDAEFSRVLGFLELDLSAGEIASIQERYSFRAVTGGDIEVKDAHVRKGQAGDWRNYFAASWADYLPAEFFALLIELGYERSDRWRADLPAKAPCHFDLSRFRISSSATKCFIDRWLDDEALQRAFPRACTDFGPHSYFAWLEGNPETRVRRWFRVASVLAKRWNACAIPDKAPHPADILMGY
ncbi:MAG: sulfotransferase domain-containing protein [Gemmataceae bacterium]